MAALNESLLFKPPEKMQIEEYSIYWERYGNGPNVVLCVAGLLGDVNYSFYPVWKKMEVEKFTFIGMDLPGYGNSRPPERNYFRPEQEFIFDRDARLAKKLLEQLGYQQFSIIGSSGGGNVAMSISCQFPDFVHRIVVCNSPFEIVKRDVLVFKLMSNLDNWPVEQKNYILAKYGRAYAEKVVRSWGQYLDMELPIQMQSNRTRSAAKEHLKAPMLAIVGLKDSVVLPSGAREFQLIVHHMRIHEVKEGQHCHLSFLDEFVRVSQEFLLN